MKLERQRAAKPTARDGLTSRSWQHNESLTVAITLDARRFDGDDDSVKTETDRAVRELARALRLAIDRHRNGPWGSHDPLKRRKDDEWSPTTESF